MLSAESWGLNVRFPWSVASPPRIAPIGLAQLVLPARSDRLYPRHRRLLAMPQRKSSKYSLPAKSISSNRPRRFHRPWQCPSIVRCHPPRRRLTSHPQQQHKSSFFLYTIATSYIVFFYQSRYIPLRE